MNKEKMGEYLIALRTEKGLTQQEEAELFSITPQAVSKWELGLSAPDIETLEKLSRFYGVSINEILNGEPMKEKAKTVSPLRARVLSRLASFICTCSFFLFGLILYAFPFFDGYIRISPNYSAHVEASAYDFVVHKFEHPVLSWSIPLCLLVSLTIFGLGFGKLFSEKHAKGFWLAQHILMYVDLLLCFGLVVSFCVGHLASWLYLINIIAYVITFYALPSNRPKNLKE